MTLPEKQLGNQAFPSNRNTNLTERSEIMAEERIKRQKAAKRNAAPCDINKSPEPAIQNLQDNNDSDLILKKILTREPVLLPDALKLAKPNLTKKNLTPK